MILKTIGVLQAPVDPTSTWLPKELETMVGMLCPVIGGVNPIGRALAAPEMSPAIVSMLVRLLKNSLAASNPTPPKIRWHTIGAASFVLVCSSSSPSLAFLTFAQSGLLTFSPGRYRLFAHLLDTHNFFRLISEGSVLSFQHLILFPDGKPRPFDLFLGLCVDTLSNPSAAPYAPSVRTTARLYILEVFAPILEISLAAQRSDQWSIMRGAGEVLLGTQPWIELAEAARIPYKDLPDVEEKKCGWKACTVEVAKNRCAGCKVARWVPFADVAEPAF